MSSLFDKLFKTTSCEKQRFGMLYESFLKSKRRSRFQTEKTYRIKSNISLIDKSKFLYDIPDSMIFPNTADIDETEENADVFLKEFGELLDTDYYLPESILTQLGLSHLIENQNEKIKEKLPEVTGKSSNSVKVSKNNEQNINLSSTQVPNNSATVNLNNKKNDTGNDFQNIMNQINSLKRKYNTENETPRISNPICKNMRKNISTPNNFKTTVHSKPRVQSPNVPRFQSTVSNDNFNASNKSSPITKNMKNNNNYEGISKASEKSCQADHQNLLKTQSKNNPSGKTSHGTGSKSLNSNTYSTLNELEIVYCETPSNELISSTNSIQKRLEKSVAVQKKITNNVFPQRRISNNLISQSRTSSNLLPQAKTSTNALPEARTSSKLSPPQASRIILSKTDILQSRSIEDYIEETIEKSSSSVSSLDTLGSKVRNTNTQHTTIQHLHKKQPPTSEKFPRKRKCPRKRNTKNNQFQNEFLRNMHQMFNHVLEELKLNSTNVLEAQQFLIANAERLTCNNTRNTGTIPITLSNNDFQMENSQSETNISNLSCNPKGKEVNGDIQMIVNSSPSDISKTAELDLCRPDSISNVISRTERELEFQPEVDEFCEATSPQIEPTRRPLIFLKDPSLLLKASQNNDQASEVSNNEQSQVIDNFQGTNEKLPECESTQLTTPEYPNSLASTTCCSEHMIQTTAFPNPVEVDMIDEPEPENESKINLKDISLEIADDSSTDGSRNRIEIINDTGMRNNCTDIINNYTEIRNDDTVIETDDTEVRTNNTEIDNTDVRSDTTLLRNDNTQVRKNYETTSGMKEKTLKDFDKTQSDILKKTLEINTELMKILTKQKAQLDELTNSKKSCDKCTEVTDVLYLTEISAEQKICILQSLHTLSQQ